MAVCCCVCVYAVCEGAGQFVYDTGCSSSLTGLTLAGSSILLADSGAEE